MKTLNSRTGFTLIEVVIAVTIMAFLSFFTATSINRALKAKDKIQVQVDQSSSVRDVLNFMVRDIELAFNYRDRDIELYNLAIQQKTAPPKEGDPPPPPPPEGQVTPTPKEDKIVTQFIGEEDKLDFSSLSYIRTQANVPLSSQAEVGYYVDSCSKGNQCLWRRVSPYIDDKITEGGTKTPLLPNVRSLSFRYLGPGFEEEWSKSWSSDGNGAQSMAGNFPYAVEVTLEVSAGKNKLEKDIKISKVARIHFSNNKEKLDENPTPTP